MKRPNFEQIFSSPDEFLERTDPKPIKSFVPNQAMKLSELMSRFERGQRLNVHTNFKPMSNFTDGKVYEETFDEVPPICHDVVDVQEYYEAHKAHKAAFQQRQKEKAKQAKQPKQAPQADPTPPDPAVQQP